MGEVVEQLDRELARYRRGPVTLLGALQDRVHKEVGRARPARLRLVRGGRG